MKKLYAFLFIVVALSVGINWEEKFADDFVNNMPQQKRTELFNQMTDSLGRFPTSSEMLKEFEHENH